MIREGEQKEIFQCRWVSPRLTETKLKGSREMILFSYKQMHQPMCPGSPGSWQDLPCHSPLSPASFA